MVKKSSKSKQNSTKSPAPKAKPAANGKVISVAEAVRLALGAGMDMPADIQGFVKSHFGLDIPKPTISSYKSHEKARQAKKSGETSVFATTAHETRRAVNGEADLIGSLEVMKPLVASMGAAKVKRLVDLMG